VLRGNTVRVTLKTFDWDSLQVDALDATLTLMKKIDGKFKVLAGFEAIKIMDTGGFVGENAHSSLNGERLSGGHYLIYWDTGSMSSGDYSWLWEGKIDGNTEFRERVSLSITDA